MNTLPANEYDKNNPQTQIFSVTINSIKEAVHYKKSD